jgi:predicted cupin superfamily sugar epimerase
VAEVASITSRLSAKQIIDLLQLAPLPGEGGFFRETYRSAEHLPQGTLSAQYCGTTGRSAGTCIYYLLTPDTYSALHRLASDEVYHFYFGDAVELIMLDEKGRLQSRILGNAIDRGQHCQLIVPSNVWQGSRLIPGGSWALLGTTMSPGFDWADFELANSKLLEAFPSHRPSLERFLPN